MSRARASGSIFTHGVDPPSPNTLCGVGAFARNMCAQSAQRHWRSANARGSESDDAFVSCNAGLGGVGSNALNDDVHGVARQCLEIARIGCQDGSARFGERHNKRINS